MDWALYLWVSDGKFYLVSGTEMREAAWDDLDMLTCFSMRNPALSLEDFELQSGGSVPEFVDIVASRSERDFSIWNMPLWNKFLDYCAEGDWGDEIATEGVIGANTP